jgi:hypothetical protein
VERLLRCEDSLEATCAKAAIPCRILRPKCPSKGARKPMSRAMARQQGLQRS